jgi:dihydroorotate dehydrogenase (NAD+) catalytic subunit
MEVNLKIKIRDIEFKNPVWVASGTFGYGDEFNRIFDINQLGAIVTKSITLKPRKGTIPPRIVETAGGMLNAIGLANIGIEKFISEKIPFYRKLQTKIIVNVAGSTDEEYKEVVKKLEPYNEITGYELNFSCPNVKEGGICFGVSPVMIENLTREIRKITDKPIIVKLTPNVTDIASTAIAAEKGGADAVSLINTLVGMAVNIHTFEPKLGNITGGLSGPAIKPVALAKLYEVYPKISIPVIGMGGIINVQDALEFFITGATAIQIGTANFIEPLTAVKILNELKNYCINKNFSSIYDIIGKLKVYHNED